MFMNIAPLPNSCVGKDVPMEVGVTYNVSGQDVPVSMEMEQHFYPPIPGYGCVPEAKHNWRMYLQRYDEDTWDWNTIGSRTGYVSELSPSHRTFTGIKRSNAYLRIVIIFEYVYYGWRPDGTEGTVTYRENFYTDTFKVQ